MQCQICNKNLGEYQCSKCGRIVCMFDEKTIDNKILCLNCIRTATSKPKTTMNSLKTVILSVAILFAAMLFIFYFITNYIQQMPSIPLLDIFVALFKTAGFFLVSGVGFILFILIFVYLMFRKKTPKGI